MLRLSLGAERTSSASGITTTDAVLVWMRPSFSVAGTRCTRWTPASWRSRRKAPGPEKAALANLQPPVSVLVCSMICRGVYDSTV